MKLQHGRHGIHTYFAISCAFCLLSTAVSAAPTVWSEVVQETTAADISLNGTIVDAVNISNGLDPITVDLDGESITFRSDTNNFANATGQGDFYSGNGGDSGNAALDQIFDSHGWFSSDTTLSITGLTAGTPYQIQIIGAADRRDCCSGRNQIISDGMGALTDDLSRMGPGSVIGTFTAETDSQFFRVGTGFVNGVDPGLSAYIVRAVPEPAGLMSVFFAVIMMVRFRKHA